MILVSVGSSDGNFDRLLKIIDELCEEKILNGKDVVAQIGKTVYTPKNYKSFELVGREDFQRYLESSEFIITHAGTGCVVPPLKMGKKIIVFPRLEKYNEHLDNHQLELAREFTSRGFVLSAQNKEELIDCINKVKKFQPNKFVSNKDNINKMIIDYIEKM